MLNMEDIQVVFLLIGYMFHLLLYIHNDKHITNQTNMHFLHIPLYIHTDLESKSKDPYICMIC